MNVLLRTCVCAVCSAGAALTEPLPFQALFSWDAEATSSSPKGHCEHTGALSHSASGPRLLARRGAPGEPEDREVLGTPEDEGVQGSTLSLPVGWRVAIHSDTFPKICRTLPADVNYCLSNPKTPCQSPKQRRSSARTARRNTNSSASKRMRLCLTSNLAVASAGDRFTVEKARSSSNTFWWIVPGVKRNALAHHDYSPSNINIGI